MRLALRGAGGVGECRIHVTAFASRHKSPNIAEKRDSGRKNGVLGPGEADGLLLCRWQDNLSGHAAFLGGDETNGGVRGNILLVLSFTLADCNAVN